ncbi:MAG: aminotransferase class V-fold PLP-dependent enzyme [Woeseiaceae bacterium]|nr:aminotransferase class V-fold PLP-dependent enzyme [Woeseiaceae bacterium]
MTMRRREFLKGAGSIPLSLGLAGAATRAAAAVEADAARAFGFAEDRVPMNAANLCPMPSAISAAVHRFQTELDTDMSAASRRRVEAFKDDARQGIARQLGVLPSEIAIVRNTSEANNIIVQGAALADGDQVLLWDQNHPSNLVAWSVRAERQPLELKRLSIPVDAGSVDEVVDRFAAAVSDDTRVVSFTHISNVTGFRLPADEVCAAIRRKNPRVHIHVDGAQTWGAADVDLRRMDCDSFSGSAHKWYMGPREVGMLYVREARQGSIWPGVVSVPWGSEATPEVPGARRFEALGQRDDAAIAALAETVRFHDELTPAGVERRSTEIADRLRATLIDLDLPFLSSKNPLFKSSVIILRAPQENRAQLTSNVLRDGGVILATVNGLRMSPHVYNTPEHVERVAAAIDRSRHLLG